MKEEYSETIPRREHDLLDAKCYELTKEVNTLKTEYDIVQNSYKRVLGKYKKRTIFINIIVSVA